MRPYLPAAHANSMQLLPDMTIPEERYILPILGQDLYDQLLEPGLDEDYENLLEKCRAVLTPMAYVHHLPFLQVLVTDNGVIAMETDHSRKAYKWEYNKVIDEMTNRGYSAQELLITYLNKKTDTFSAWQESPYNDTDGFAFIRNGKELGQVLNLLQPHRSYMSLKPLFYEIGLETIQDLLGPSYYEALSQRVYNNNFESEKMVVRYIRMIAAKLAMAKACYSLNVQLTGQGFTIADKLKDTPEEGRSGLSGKELDMFAVSMKKDAAALMERLRELLNTDASNTTFPEYFSSTKYQNPHDAGMNLNKDRTGFFPI